MLIIFALLALALVIAVLGIVNTLALSVIERTREVGLLRAIGLSRRQLRRMIRLESVVIAVLGALLGRGDGHLLRRGADVLPARRGARGDQRPLGPARRSSWCSPLVIGVLAAVFPARRAARLDVLRAIATE